MKTPMTLHIYDENSEIKATFVRSFVPWKLLKEAVKIAKNLNPKNMSEENVEELTGLVVAVFGDKFTVDQLNEGADVSEMVAVLQQIVSTANGVHSGPYPSGVIPENSELTIETMIDLEIGLVRAFNWSLRDIDETDIESLLPFISRLNSDGQDEKKAFADEVDFL